MAERRKNDVHDLIGEADKQFLEKSGTNAHLRDLLTRLIDNRPEDPFAFIADHFDSLGDQSARLSKVHQSVQLADPTQSSFAGILHSSYEALCSCRGKPPYPALTGALYMELMVLLCKDFPKTIQDQLLAKLNRRNYEVVSVTTFHSAVFTWCVLRDFLSCAEALFSSLDTTGTGKVDRALGEAIVDHLRQAVRQAQYGKPYCILAADLSLLPDKTFSVLAEVVFKKTGSKGHMTCQEFITSLAETFLCKVVQFR